MDTPVSDLHIKHNVPLPAPALIIHEQPRTSEQANTIAESRRAIQGILNGDDERFLVVVGPCSIPDPKSGLAYAEKLAALRAELSDKLEIVMRVYFEKPRTTVGWKGLIMDPDLDDSSDLPKGLRLARGVLREVVDLGLPTATEFLDPITPQYISDLISWAAIGARTVESQTHRQMASGLSMPVGFKNATSGGLATAVNALKASSQPQTFFGISPEGVASMVSTTGNPFCHLVLRGNSEGPNFSAEHVAAATEALEKGKVSGAIMIDASHANCSKDYEKMPGVFEEVVAQRAAGNKSIVAAMLESNILPGRQDIPENRSEIVDGLSITDPCIDWETTERILRDAAEKL